MSTSSKSKIPTSIITRDLEAIGKSTNNIYEALIIISKRAKQIAIHSKEELDLKLQDFAMPVDSLTEVFENHEQIEISRYYERMPKPTNVAVEELLSDELFYRHAQSDSPSEKDQMP